jgi:hypothetical protein
LDNRAVAGRYPALAGLVSSETPGAPHALEGVPLVGRAPSPLAVSLVPWRAVLVASPGGPSRVVEARWPVCAQEDRSIAGVGRLLPPPGLVQASHLVAVAVGAPAVLGVLHEIVGALCVRDPAARGSSVGA